MPGDYGSALPDQVEGIAKFLDAHLEVINDARDLYASRVTLEREYAGKLQALSRKAAERKAKMQLNLLFGSGSANASEKESTLNTAYDEIIASVANSAQVHMLNADNLNIETIETLKTLGRRNDEAKKKILAFFQKILSERDRVFGDRIKHKQKYDDQCAEVESIRHKQGRAADDKHADRAAKHAEEQRDNMLNSKNSYLISIAIANDVQRKFYNEDIPQLENELQKLQHHLVERFVKVVEYSQQLELNSLNDQKTYIENLNTILNTVDIAEDQELFISLNVRTFVAPDDWKFEPSSIHYDTAEMNKDPAPKIVLQNKLRRSQEKLAEVDSLMKSARAESDQFDSQLSSYNADHSVGAVDDLIDKYLEVKHQTLFYATSQSILKAEVGAILAAIGDDLGAAKPHTFKSTSFSIPAECGYCQAMIWGLSKQGKTCKACGLSVHSKCELKVAANCEKSEGQSPSSIRKHTDASSIKDHAVAAPTPSAFVQSIAPQELVEELVEARVLFNFVASSEFELEVREGMSVHILEPDDGSGWAKVQGADGNSGLVPASYIEITTTSETQPPMGERVWALYAYKGQTPEELDIQEGEILELSPGGKQYGNGWWEGFNSQGRMGIFPSNYVKHI